MNLGMTQSQADTTGWRGTDEGGKLKETGTTHWASPNTGATNSSGFTALPGGDSWAGSFLVAGLYGYWWSSTESGGNAWRRLLGYAEARVDRSTDNKAYGFSCRCVKDIDLFDNLIISVSDTRHVRISPNPFTESTLLEFDNKGKEKLTLLIYDISGKLVREYADITMERVVIERRDLKPGTYYLGFAEASGSYYVGKFIISSTSIY